LTDPQHTAVTNIFTGRPARALVNRLVREVGPISPVAPSFPNARFALTPLRAAAGDKADDFAFWNAGQGAPLGRTIDAAALVRLLADQAKDTLRALSS
jgi:nitronate monooxygenase